MEKKLIKYMIPMIVIIVGVLWYLLSCDLSSNERLRESTYVMQMDTEKCADKNNSIETKEFSGIEIKLISVHVCGAVVKPGVYQLEEGARVIQAIEAAGGVCNDAKQDYLNLACFLRDGDKIYVPSAEEIESGDIPDNTYETIENILCININTATKSELMQLPGIGESKADSIILYRKEHGNFKTTEDIMLINGIKEAVYNQIKDYIKVQN